jgi:hypothetical protein
VSTQSPIQCVPRALSPEYSGQSVKLPTRLQLVPKAKKSWVSTSTPNTSSRGILDIVLNYLRTGTNFILCFSLNRPPPPSLLVLTKLASGLLDLHVKKWTESDCSPSPRYSAKSVAVGTNHAVRRTAGLNKEGSHSCHSRVTTEDRTNTESPTLRLFQKNCAFLRSWRTTKPLLPFRTLHSMLLSISKYNMLKFPSTDVNNHNSLLWHLLGTTG